jgi:putative endonuclease
MGEQAAVNYLVDGGYEIEQRNWRSGRNEIDIIANYQGIKIIVEVKSRLSDEYAEPEMTVSPRQMARLANAYGHYAEQIDYNGECRFDIIGVLFVDPLRPIINHFEDAFFPS